MAPLILTLQQILQFCTSSQDLLQSNASESLTSSSQGRKDLTNQPREAIYHGLFRISKNGKLERGSFTKLGGKNQVDPNTNSIILETWKTLEKATSLVDVKNRKPSLGSNAVNLAII